MDYDRLSRMLAVPRGWADIVGYTDFEPLYEAAVAAAPPGALLVEIGCFLGRSLCMLGTFARGAGRGHRVVGVDHCCVAPSDGEQGELTLALGGTFAGVLTRNVTVVGLAPIVSVLVQDSVVAAELFADRSVFFAFIDADHSFEAVSRDIRAWLPKIRPDGILSGHDYNDRAWPGIRRAVESVFGPEDRTDPLARTCWSIRMAGWNRG
jgi:hypothetical protein